MFWGYSFSEMLQKNASTQLMTYLDQDGNSGVFVFHCNNKHQQHIPLGIIVPSELQGNKMIEDWYISNLDQIETDNALADQYGGSHINVSKDGHRYVFAFFSKISSEQE